MRVRTEVEFDDYRIPRFPHCRRYETNGGANTQGQMFSDLNFNAGRFHSWYINPCVQLASRQLKAQMSSIPDELTATVFSIVGSLPQLQKAKLILDHCLALLEAG